MEKAISIAILFFACMAVLFFVSKTPLSVFVEEIGAVGRRVFFGRPKKSVRMQGTQSVYSPPDRARSGTDVGKLHTTGASAENGVPMDVTVLDRDDRPIGRTRVTVGTEPVLIGRGEDDDWNGVKLVLPDVVSDRPTTSRRHCTISLVNGTPILKDCYTREESMCNGRPRHSMSFVGKKYVGGGLPLRRSVRVGIGDYTLLLEPAFKASVPTFGAHISGNMPTFGADTDRDAPTKPFDFRKRGEKYDQF